MKSEDLRVEDRPRDRDVRYLKERLFEFNIRRTGIDDARDLAIFVRDDEAAIVAGVCGFTWGGCLVVETLWVAETRRGRGLGQQLMSAAEAEAKARGCRYSILGTHSFQAPAFYARLGYGTVAAIEDFPAGHQSLSLRKQLS